MGELNTIQNIVENILRKRPSARDSDNFLYYLVCCEVGRENGVDVNTMSVPCFLLQANELNLPKFETVRRTRQKLQASYPELTASERVRDCRAENETIYREYAKG